MIPFRSPSFLALAAFLSLPLSASASAPSAPFPERMHPPAPIQPHCAGMSIQAGSGYTPVYRHAGQSWIEGKSRQEYTIRLHNSCSHRVLAVVSVDGLNVIDGSPASFDQTGYVLDPGSSSTIRGWRKSMQDTASFYFTYPGDSYAERTGQGGNLGAIGAAFFSERQMLAVPMESADSMANGAAKSMESARAAAPSLGTGHGRRVYDPATQTTFDREERPFLVETIRYETRRNLERMGVIPAPRPSYPAPNPFPGQGGFTPDPPPSGGYPGVPFGR